MSAPLTANDIASHLAKLSRQLDDLVQQIGRAEVAAVNAREDSVGAAMRAETALASAAGSP